MNNKVWAIIILIVRCMFHWEQKKQNQLPRWFLRSLVMNRKETLKYINMPWTWIVIKTFLYNHSCFHCYVYTYNWCMFLNQRLMSTFISYNFRFQHQPLEFFVIFKCVGRVMVLLYHRIIGCPFWTLTSVVFWIHKITLFPVGFFIE